MKIVSIKERRKKRIEVEFEDGSSVIVNQLMLTDAYLYVGKEMTEEAVEELVSESGIKDAFATAMNFIGYQARTENEVRRRLQKDEVDYRVIDHVIDRLLEEKYLNDMEYAQSYYEQNRWRYGVMRIRYKLAEKGIREEILESLYMEDDLEGAVRQAEKKYGDLRGEIDYAMKGKMSKYLSGRGYLYETVKKVVRYFEEKV